MIEWEKRPVPDKGFKNFLYRMSWIPSQGIAYWVTLDEKYVKSWIDVYGDFLKQYPLPQGKGEGKDGAFEFLSNSVRVSNSIDMFFYSILAENFTKEWLATYLIAMCEQVEHARRNYYYWGDYTSNITLTQEMTVVKAGILYPELKTADEWVKDGAGRMAGEVNKLFLKDGMLWEVDQSYHVGTLQKFYDLMELLKKNKREELIPEGFAESLRKPSEVLVNLIYPDYTFETFNDTRRTWAKQMFVKNLNKYMTLFPDMEGLEWMATSGKSKKEPTQLTKAFPYAGYYVLRDGWKKSSTMLIHTNNPTGAWHNQGDNGTISLYRNGRRFLPDAGCYTYNNGEEREWYRSAKQHNTMTLDDKSINDENRNGRFVKMEEIGNNTAVVVTSNQSYENLIHRRAIFHVNREFFVIVDQGIGEAKGKVSVNFHLCEGNDNEVVYDLDKCGAHTDFADGNNMIYRTFSDSKIEAKSIPSKVSWNIAQTADRKAYEVNLNKDSAKTVSFISVIVPTVHDDKNISAKFMPDNTDDNIAVCVNIDGKDYMLNCKL